MASKEIRGILTVFIQFSIELGILIAFTLGSILSLITFNVVCAILLIIFTICFMFLPESPVYLIRKNRNEEAEKSIKLLRGAAYDAKAEIREFQDAFEQALKGPKSSLKEIAKRETAKAFGIILCVFFFFQMSGINAVTFYTTAIFIDAGIEMDPSLATISLGIVMVIATFATAAFVDRFGRVFLLIVSFVLMIAGLVGIGTFFTIQNKADYNWLPLTSLCIFVIGFSAGIGPVPFVLLAEMFSSNAKKIIAPFAQTINFTMSFGIGLLFPYLVNNFGNGLTFFMFAGFCFVGLLFTIFVIPETKGKSLIEIQTLLRN